MDVKKLSSIPPGGGWKIHGRGNAPAEGAGWAFVHSIVDDYTRLAYTEPLPDEKGTTVAAFTARALARLPPKRRHPHYRGHDRQPLEIHPQPSIRFPASSARHPSYHESNPIIPSRTAK